MNNGVKNGGQLELNESFENVRKERNRRVRLRNMRRIAVAASVLLLVTVGGYLVRKGDRYRRAFPANDGNGRKRTGFLTLSTGERVVLSQQDTLLQSEEISIRVNRAEKPCMKQKILLFLQAQRIILWKFLRGQSFI